MDKISNMPHLDENKNSSALDNDVPENDAFSLSQLQSGGVDSSSSVQNATSEVNSNITIQFPKNINSLTSEVGGIAVSDMSSNLDTSNASLLGETVSSYKSCNESFLGDVNTSFKSLNGSYVMQTTNPNSSVKDLLDETITKVQLSSLNANVSVQETESNTQLDITFNNANSEVLGKDVSLSENKSDTSANGVSDVTFEANLQYSSVNEVKFNNANSYQPDKDTSLNETTMPDASLLPTQEVDDSFQVSNNSSLDGALAAFTNLKLEDSVSDINISQSKETLNDSIHVHDKSNLIGFTSIIQDGPNADEFNFKIPCFQIDSLSTVEKNYLECQTSQLEEPTEVFDGALGDDPFGLKGMEVYTNPTDDFVFKVPENPADLQSQTFSQLSELIEDSTSTCLPETGSFGSDPFELKGGEFNTSPTDGFVFKVPENPVDTESEEFTDAVQFFKDPSSFQFLENIKTSPPAEGNTPRSSLYIKFDPLHSSFPRNPKSSDVLQALKNETGLEANMQSLNVSARESLGNILISFDSPRMTSSQEPKTPIFVAPAKVYTEEELQQHLNINELTNQEILLKKQREMEEDLAKKEREMMSRAEEKDKKIADLEKIIKAQHGLLEEFVIVSGTLSEKDNGLDKKMKAIEEENSKLKDDVKTLTEDLQSVETTFADFHKRYELCKGMLKTFKENEELLKTKLKELEQDYQDLQDSTQAALEKASFEVGSVKKTSEAQTAVLKAQLKKAEMKISGLESDIRQIKLENCQLGGICDDLMEKVGQS